MPLGNGNSYFNTNQVFVDSGNHFYVMGAVGVSSSTLQPCYWKDGVLVILSSGGVYAFGQAAGAAFDGSGNLYVSGVVGRSSTSQYPCYWENGLGPSVLSLSSSNTYGWVNGIAWDGSNNMFFAGAEGTSSTAEVPALWTLGGVPTDFPDPGNGYGFARGVAASGGTVYIAAAEGADSSSVVPFYWSGAVNFNGNVVGSTASLPKGTNSYGWARSVVASGATMYFTGIQGPSSSSNDPCFWTMPPGTVTSQPLGSGRSVYWTYWAAADASGNLYTPGALGSSSTNPVPCYWKNGSLNMLPMGNQSKIVPGRRGIAARPLE